MRRNGWPYCTAQTLSASASAAERTQAADELGLAEHLMQESGILIYQPLIGALKSTLKNGRELSPILADKRQPGLKRRGEVPILDDIVPTGHLSAGRGSLADQSSPRIARAVSSKISQPSL